MNVIVILQGNALEGLGGTERVANREVAERLCSETPLKATKPYLFAPTASFFDRAGNYAKNLLLLHDEEVFAVKLDLSSGVFAEQDAIAFCYR